MRLTYIIFIASFLIAASKSIISQEINEKNLEKDAYSIKQLRKTKSKCLDGNDKCIKTKIKKKKKVLIQAQSNSVTDWHIPDNWAYNCDFKNSDFNNTLTSPNLCGPTCAQNERCTHFTWTNYLGGTCWMKEGPATFSDALDKFTEGAICGIVGNKINPPTPPPPSNGLNCIAYEPFSNKNYPGNVNQALKDTLSAVVNQGFKCIKTYYSQYYGLKIADYAQQYNLKIILGIMMGQSFTETEIQTAISSCKSNSNILGIYAGNENLPNGQITQDIFNIKNRLKTSGCNIPFGTVQTIGYYLFNADKNLVNQMDWLGYNVYPFFSNLGGSSSIQSLQNQIGQLKNKYGSSFSKFIITETGWPSAGGNSPQGNPSTIAKAKEYGDSFANMLCSGQFNTPWVSYFIFFDPIYKQNVPDYEHYFGLVDSNGKPKWNIQNLHC